MLIFKYFDKWISIKLVYFESLGILFYDFKNHYSEKEIHQAASGSMKEKKKRVLLWHRGLRIQHFHCSSLGHCCSAGSVRGPWTETTHRGQA